MQNSAKCHIQLKVSVSFVLLYFDFWTILVHGSFDDSSYFVHVNINIIHLTHTTSGPPVVPRFLALQHVHICVDRGKFRTYFALSKNPSAKTLINCFIHKSSTGSGKRKEQNSYYNPPLVGKSYGEDTITTHFDWKK